jgi:hypothetical protein
MLRFNISCEGKIMLQLKALSINSTLSGALLFGGHINSIVCFSSMQNSNMAACPAYSTDVAKFRYFSPQYFFQCHHMIQNCPTGFLADTQLLSGDTLGVHWGYGR